MSKGKKVPWWWMRNDKGTQSVSVTFASVSFLVTTLIYLGSAFEKAGPFTFRHFDVSAAMTYFIPALSLYFGRRLTDAKYQVNVASQSQQDVAQQVDVSQENAISE